jgi:hypothetical protein
MRSNEKQWEARPYFAENGSEARRQIFALLSSSFHLVPSVRLPVSGGYRFTPLRFAHTGASSRSREHPHKNTQKHNTTAAAPARGLLLGQAFEEDVIRVLTSSIIWRERNAQYRA